MYKIQEILKERAEKAVKIPGKFGPDFDPSAYIEGTRDASSGADLSRRIEEASLLSGFDLEEKNRSASYFQKNEEVLMEKVNALYHGQVEIMAIEKALEKYDWLWDYWWKAVPVDMDKYTAYTELYHKGGYFIRIFAGAKIEQPLQSCLLLAEN